MSGAAAVIPPCMRCAALNASQPVAEGTPTPHPACMHEVFGPPCEPALEACGGVHSHPPTRHACMLLT